MMPKIPIQKFDEDDEKTDDDGDDIAIDMFPAPDRKRRKMQKNTKIQKTK